MFAAPSYLERRGRPRSLADLARHDAITHQLGIERWGLTGRAGRETVEVTGIIAGDPLGFLTDAAVAGLGVALLPVFSIASHLETGVLTRVLPRYSTAIGLQLLTHDTRRVPHRVALARDFLAERLSGVCTKHR